MAFGYAPIAFAAKNKAFLVEAPGIEADSGRAENTIEHENGSIGVQAGQIDEPDRAPKCTIVGRDETESSEAYELSNLVETALAKALVLAAEAKRWDVVAQIAEELGRRSQNEQALAGDGSGRPRPSNCGKV